MPEVACDMLRDGQGRSSGRSGLWQLHACKFERYQSVVLIAPILVLSFSRHAFLKVHLCTPNYQDNIDRK
jgi:hypothetical protein